MVAAIGLQDNESHHLVDVGTVLQEGKTGLQTPSGFHIQLPPDSSWRGHEVIERLASWM